MRALYIGFMPRNALIEKTIEDCCKRASLRGEQEALHLCEAALANGPPVHNLLNDSAKNGAIALSAWGVDTMEEGAR